MSSQIPESHRDLLEGPIIVSLATHMPDSSIQVTPVWCSYDGTHIIVNATRGRQKHKNIEANPNVTVMAFDPENQFRFIEVRGTVETITAEGGGESMNALALLYTGKPKRYGIEAPPREVDERVLYYIKPVRVNTAG
ncbi:PPOX class F420-dependent oxidoreductase [Phototrophicus methaneseepsis]|uniref:PPOX class F420-dependent oxidoreductase n=1 Tax=Phototrophicus methaneseepsis TaxID=2710758 RepID=A0A7S8E8X8_9CHLR|nr:PPOX class F420-dependent oxidoreductase [Phototrophicus methaneseepsis]QPC82535.1 PPOX class F420-dependent oxidoreductase [Phototrophicus methaneseepsis]